MSDNPYTVVSASAGMDSDSLVSALKNGQLTYAQNALIENIDGRRLTYQNEQSNQLCGKLEEGFTVIGVKNIIEQGRTIIFAVNSQANESLICQQRLGSCEFATIIRSACLNFQPQHPIHKVIVKSTNCSTQLYWTDGFNPRRWIDLEDLPWKEIPDPDRPGKMIKLTGTVDCNKILVQPAFSIPQITETAAVVGGDLQMGTYQFAVQYANATGGGLTSFYSITNPLGIWQPRYSQDMDLKTDQAISVTISHLDTTGLYDYFNLAVIKTINNITSVELAGTYPVGSGSAELLYTGESKSDIRLTLNDIFERFPYYDIAQDVTASDDALIWADLSTVQKSNYQQIWSKVKLYWESWKVPYNKFEGYSNPVNTSRLRTYMRDEVYAMEGCFVLRNGKITEKCHIPGRLPTLGDLQVVDNEDVITWDQDSCKTRQPVERWKIYNTASVTGYSPEYVEGGSERCYKGPYQYGHFGFFQSEEKYPDNEYIWGELAGSPIRHHRFPDCGISPIHDNNPDGSLGFEHVIYPIGIKVDVASLYAAIEASDLSSEEKSQIAGFKIMRANRVNHRSVVAKGLLFNIGKYTYEGTSYYYPNYPFNDLRDDPFLAGEKIKAGTGNNIARRLKGFADADSKSRFTFHSPDTHFYQPFGVNTGYLKLEAVSYGKSRSHFVAVKDNAKYKFLTQDATRLAFASGMASVVTLDVGGGMGLQAFQAQAGLQLDSVIPSFESTLQVIKNITPALNYGWQMNAVGNYCNMHPISDSGAKIRQIALGGYLAPGMQHLGDDRAINNLRRESAVYIKTANILPYPHEVSAAIPADDSRYLISEKGCSSSPTEVTQRNICSYYGAIKRALPAQYGRMYSYESVDTGYYQRITTEAGGQQLRFSTVFGGDCYIGRFSLKRKLSFFLDETVNKAEGTDINLDDLANVGYPMYWYSTKPIDVEVDLSGLEDEIHTLTDFSFWTVVGNLISGGTRPLRAGFTILNKLFQAYLQVLGVTNINLDCASTKNMNKIGRAYLFCYGIPYYFVESEINTDYRQAINSKEGDYFPSVGQDIPDDWLQETNVPIASDNLYVYNKSYSKQNKETYFHPLPQSYDPAKSCQTHYSNRLIYSEKGHMEETKNNWLVYRPVSYHDLPKSHGKICAIDGLEDSSVLARFEQKSLLYNVMATLQTESGIANLGNPAMFSQRPLDFVDSDLGFAGSGNKLLLKTAYGQCWIDASRGQVMLLKGTQVENLATKGMYHWLLNNLPFQVSRHFPQVNADNHFTGIGLTGAFDSRFNRLLVTKKDYQPLHSGIVHRDGNFFVDGVQVRLTDERHFCNKSWTLSYSFLTGSWIAFHSYIPDYYIAHPTYFQTGFNTGIWDHNKAQVFGSFYGKPAEYILEYPVSFGGAENIVGAFSDYTTALKYEDEMVCYQPEEQVYFNQAIIYSDSQCSGILNLVPKPRGNLAAYLHFPKYNADSKDILVTKSDHLYNFNQFWDIIKDHSKPFYKIPCDRPSLDKILMTENLDYSSRPHHKTRIRSKDARIRLIYFSQGPYKLMSNFLLTNTQPSTK